MRDDEGACVGDTRVFDELDSGEQRLLLVRVLEDVEVESWCVHLQAPKFDCTVADRNSKY